MTWYLVEACLLGWASSAVLCGVVAFFYYAGRASSEF